MNESNPRTAPDDHILARVGVLTDRFVEYARQRGRNVARGLETGELAALLVQKYAEGLLMALNEIYDPAPRVLDGLRATMDECVAQLDPDWRENGRRRYRSRPARLANDDEARDENDCHTVLRARCTSFFRSDAVWRRIERAYTGVGRHYHTLQHLGELFAVLKAYEDHPWWPAIELAVWFHDFVYSVDPEHYRQNEVLSAKAMAQCVAALCDGDWTAHHAEHLALAEKIIQATASHAVPAVLSAASFGTTEHAQQLMLDADLAIFAMSPSRLAEYDRQIQQEWGQDPACPSQRFADARKAALQAFLEGDRIFGTAEFGRLEQVARVQVAALIERY